MKSVVLLIVALMVFGCSSDRPTEPSVNVSIGEVHNELLAALYAVEAPEAQRVSGVDRDIVAYRVAKQLALKYGIEPLTVEEVQEALDMGRQMAQRDPVELVRSVLPEADFEWWDRFANEAEVHDAREVFNRHCELYGSPRAGTLLADIIDISLHSAEFWTEKHKDQQPKGWDKDDPLLQKVWWKKLIRFTTIVATDAVSGGLAAAGGGGPVVGAVVGGLCSYAVDDIFWGDK